jgi:pyruvate formate lyase activating enzyme
MTFKANIVKGNLSRREFLRKTPLGICALGAGATFSFVEPGGWEINQAAAKADSFPLKEVMFYKKLEEKRIECEICPRKCRIAELERGYCGNKENREGIYYTLVHSRVCAAHVDPIEKKPFSHFLPGTKTFSIATAGCNIECKYCQNWQIAQFRPEQVKNYNLAPKEVVRQAKKRGCKTIAYTYSEPVVFYGYMYDTARAGQREGIGSVMISNGYILEKPLLELCQYLNAVKIDLKAFTEKFYKETCSGELEPVKKTLKLLKGIDMWTEIVVLILPTMNDSEKEIKEMSKWIMGELGPDTPIHFGRFHPMYKIKNLPSTPVGTLERARHIAENEGLHYVYIGNVWGHEGENTFCPKCKKVIVRRLGYIIKKIDIVDGRCRFCRRPIAGIWQ